MSEITYTKQDDYLIPDLTLPTEPELPLGRYALMHRDYLEKHKRVTFLNLLTLISLHYLTAAFPKLLDKNELRRIRYHDLRHSCASLLLANGVPMKQIQEWLGHSDFSTTANVYAHLDYNSKLSSADAMAKGLSGALEVIS